MEDATEGRTGPLQPLSVVRARGPDMNRQLLNAMGTRLQNAEPRQVFDMKPADRDSGGCQIPKPRCRWPRRGVQPSSILGAWLASCTRRKRSPTWYRSMIDPGPRRGVQQLSSGPSRPAGGCQIPQPRCRWRRRLEHLYIASCRLDPCLRPHTRAE